MKNPINLSLKKLSIFICAICIFCSCHDNISFEECRQVKTGMTITEIEKIMGDPENYARGNDSTEYRSYAYDTPNGMDKYLRVTYVNDKATEIEDSYSN